MNKLEQTIINLRNQFANKAAMRHRPLIVVKKEISEPINVTNGIAPSDIEVNNTDRLKLDQPKEEIEPPKSSTPQPPGAVSLAASVLPPHPTAASASDQGPTFIKKELSSPAKTESLVETDQCDSIGSLVEDASPKQTRKFHKTSTLKNHSRKRILSSDSSSLDLSDSHGKSSEDLNSLMDSFRKKRRLNRLKSTSSDESNHEGSVMSSAGSYDDKMVADLKVIIEKLTSNDIQNPNEILESFESIIGKKGFSTLKTLFTGEAKKEDSPSSARSSVRSTVSDECSSSRSVEVSQKMKPRAITRTRRYKNEAEKLQADVMNMFIREGVLKAKGLRENKKVTYDEESALRVMQDMEIDDEASETQDSLSSLTSASGTLSSLETSGPSHESSSISSSDDSSSTVHSFKIKDCFVSVERLDVSNCKMPLKVNAVGVSTGAGGEKAQGTTGAISSNNLMHDNVLDQNSKEDSDKDLKQAQSKTPSNVMATKDLGVIEDGKDVEKDQTKQTYPKIKIKPEAPSTTPVKSSLLEEMHKIVCNISYIQCRGGNMLKCNCEKCEYESFDENLFRYHIQSKHVMFKWSGSCKMCNSSVSGFGSLLDEFNHLDQVHIKGIVAPPYAQIPVKKNKRGRPKIVKPDKQSTVKPVTPNSTVNSNGEKVLQPQTANQAEQGQQVVESNKEIIQPEVVEVSSIPKFPPKASSIETEPQNATETATHPKHIILKIRNLPGDKLSVKATLLEPATVEKPYLPVSAPPKPATVEKPHLPVSSPPQLNRSIELHSMTKKLKPWLNEIDFKRSEKIIAMLTEKKLSDKFKCMGSECDFSTNVNREFSLHLTVHFEKGNIDVRNFSRCCYCSFIAGTPTELEEHINIQHTFEKYSCMHCFYRSAIEFFVVKHQEAFHGDFSGKIIDTGSPDTLRFEDSLAEAKSSREKFIPSIQCIGKILRTTRQ